MLIKLRNSEIIAREEIEEYKISKNKKEKIIKKTLFRNRTFLKALALGISIGAGSQLIGINVVLLYLQTIMEAANTSVPPEIASVIIGIIQVVGSFCTTLITYRFGRRSILLCTLVGVFIGMVSLLKEIILVKSHFVFLT